MSNEMAHYASVSARVLFVSPDPVSLILRDATSPNRTVGTSKFSRLTDGSNALDALIDQHMI